MINQSQSKSLSQIKSLTEISSKTLAWEIASAADSRKAEDILILDVSELCYLADYFVINTGFSPVQLRAISDSIEKTIYEKFNKQPLRTSGKAEASWIIHDYGDVIVHTFLPQEREYYNLEAFWGHAPRFSLEAQNHSNH